jgi:ABC-type amino acid transport substrate-binding protein
MRAMHRQSRPARRPAVRRAAAAGLAVLLAAAAGACGAGESGGEFAPAREGTLSVVTQPLPTPGFWEGSDARPTGGLEYAIARELARRLGVERVEVRTEDFSAIVAGELAGADVALALITPTEERDDVLDFSTPYVLTPPALVVRAGTEVPDVRTAQELRFAVGANTTFEDIVAEQIRPDADLQRFEDRGEELDAVRGGSADVAVFDLLAAEAIVRDDPALAIAAKLGDAEPIAAALPEGSENTEAVSSALRAMAADGTLDELAERWLGVSLTDSAGNVPLLRTDEA